MQYIPNNFFWIINLSKEIKFKLTNLKKKNFNYFVEDNEGCTLFQFIYAHAPKTLLCMPYSPSPSSL